MILTLTVSLLSVRYIRFLNNGRIDFYADPFAGGYQKQDCGITISASVISTSYGMNEADVTPAYAQRQCNEYAKLGMQGVTVLYASGDYGVAGIDDECLGDAGSTSISLM